MAVPIGARDWEIKFRTRQRPSMMCSQINAKKEKKRLNNIKEILKKYCKDQFDEL